MARSHARMSDVAATGRVESLNHEGWGVVRATGVAGKVTFVAGALPGELIEYRCPPPAPPRRAELLNVLEPAAERIAPGCVHFGVCGGCAMQHLSPAAQLAVKDTQLRETLRRIGKVEPREWLPPLAGDVWGYRRRARLGARFVHAKGRSLVGFREKMSSFVAEVERCPVLRPEAGALVGELSRLITSMSIPTRIPHDRVAVGDDLTVLVVRVLEPPAPVDRECCSPSSARTACVSCCRRGRPDELEPLRATCRSLVRPAAARHEAGLEPSEIVQV